MYRIMIASLIFFISSCSKSDSENSDGKYSLSTTELALTSTNSNSSPPKNSEEALKKSLIYQLATEGQPQSMLLVGQMYLLGSNDIKRNPNIALEWLRKAAESGTSSEAQSALGHFYMTEKEFIDYGLAYKWLEKSARSDNVRGMYYLGTLYENGLGMQKDLVIACAWYGNALFSGEQLKDTTYLNIYNSIEEKYINCRGLLSNEETIEHFAMYKQHKKGELFSRIPTEINSDNDSNSETATLESDNN